MGVDMSDERRWWPITAPSDDEYATIPHRSAELIYAALGPIAAHELLVALCASKVTSPNLERVVSSLESVDGRQPDMLVLLAVAMGAVQREFNGSGSDTPSSLDGERRSVGDVHLVETYKHLGSLVYEALLAFGFTEETFGDYLRDQWFHLGYGEWPPAGAAYTQREPAIVANDSEESVGNLWDWIREGFERPTMIGAHLAGASRDLDSFSERLEEAMRFVDADLDYAWASASDSERGEFRARLEAAVDQVMTARDMVRDAEKTIVRIFST